jgi:endonuclease/exonuclease/phosphatase family metal-dependent hydrolase
MLSLSKPQSLVIRALTYNVHSCVGADRRHDPDRIADVIAACSADVIALQELDVGRRRTGHLDQAAHIANRLDMMPHFHPAMHVEDEKYGDAILTALPTRLVNGDAILTALPTRLVKVGALPSIGEPRGAIWIEVDCGACVLQVVNTHLGLRRRERRAQVAALLSNEWTGNERWKSTPSLLMGDFNAVPGSAVYRLLAGGLRPVLPDLGSKIRPTFPSRLPLLRLDHLFANDRVRTISVETINTPLARRASDHLPLLATLEVTDVQDAEEGAALALSLAVGRPHKSCQGACHNIGNSL